MSGASLYIQKVLNLYSLIGSFAAGRTSDWIGRRNTIILTATIFFAGASITGSSFNYAMLMSGAFATGVGAGYAGIIAPLYIVMLLGMPESPRWLVVKGRASEAMAVLEKTSGTREEAVERLAEIEAAAGVPGDITDGDVAAVTVQESNRETQVWKELILSPAPAMRRILFLALGIHLFQQASGVEAVVLYSPRVFRSAGITQDSRLLGATCVVGAAKMVSTLVATFLLDRVGLGVGLTAVGRAAEAEEVITVVPWAVALCIASILAYVSFFSVGLGPISALYTTDTFPLRVRALGFAAGMACNRVTSGGVAMTFLSLSKALTIGGTFLFYAGIATVALVFLLLRSPRDSRQDAGRDGQALWYRRHGRRWKSRGQLGR